MRIKYDLKLIEIGDVPREDVVEEYINKRQHTVRRIKGFLSSDYLVFAL